LSKPTIFPQEYWTEQYSNQQTGWDLGYASPPLIEYTKQLTNKDLTILIPGAGYGWEVEYLYNCGFCNVYLLEFAIQPIEAFRKRVPHFPEKNIIQLDFFDLNFTFDLILEQTFFTSFPPQLRTAFVIQMHKLLNLDGKYVGLFFNHPFYNHFPPFSMFPQEYLQLFKPYFSVQCFENCYNSIKPRAGREVFFIMQKLKQVSQEK